MNPALSAWLEYRKNNPKLLHDDPHRDIHFLSTPTGKRLETGVVVSPATVPARDGFRIPIRIYTPTPTAEEGCGNGRSGYYRGVVIFYHSGGFTSGDLETEDVSCRYMSLYAQTIVISIDYRLSPTHSYPVPINDGIDAFEYIAQNLSALLPDPDIRSRIQIPAKLVLCGTSSGGHLAAIVSQHARNGLGKEESAGAAGETVSLVGVLLRAPVTVEARVEALIPERFRGVHVSWEARYEGAEGNRESMGYNHDSLAVPAAEKTSPAAFPLWGDLGGLPRTYIQICELDILCDDAVCYAQGLKETGVEVRERFYEGLPHIFWIYNHELAVSKTAQEDCVKGLRWLLE
ncbi:Alpha/Beta hydrolase protein [Aspergillus pseudoustus]|uniref:Alpha/Beta hydrolase protein n=1 Tax=Aspergillus pseudoustus TaxID=1810923 RepID=A0ABR4JG96_9EURO